MLFVKVNIVIKTVAKPVVVIILDYNTCRNNKRFYAPFTLQSFSQHTIINLSLSTHEYKYLCIVAIVTPREATQTQVMINQVWYFF